MKVFVLLVLLVLGAAGTIVFLEPAYAQSGCSASGLSSAIAQTAKATAGILSSNPGAEEAVDSANENTIRTYFATHQDQWSQLQSAASPLRNLRNSCPQQVSAGDVARLFDAMAS